MTSSSGRLLALTLALGQPFATTEGSASEVAALSLIASSEPGWPQFRGPRRDGVSDERGLLPEWPEGGPRKIWTATGAGRGFASPIIGGGRLFVAGDFGEETRVLALDLSGKPLWSAANGSSWLNQYQGARASPTYRAGRVYHENAHGRVACFDAETGRELWAVGLLQKFRGGNITWGLSECLLVDERAVYATAGGRDALLVALDARTGETLWRSEPLFIEGDKEPLENAGYTPPILVSFAGRRLLIGCSLRHLYCADADTGKIQWTRPRLTSYSVLAMAPVVVGDGVFVTAPFGPSGRFYRLLAPAQPGDRVGVEEGWSTALDTCQGGVVHAEGRLFGSYYPNRKGWAVLDAKTGETLHETSEFTKGAAMYADRRLYALCEDGWMLLLQPGEKDLAVRGKFQLPGVRGRDAWAHPVIHDGRLYLRYHDTLWCHDIRTAP